LQERCSNPIRIKEREKGEEQMPITDPEKKRIAQTARLVMKVCFNCGCRNDINASRCRKCRNPYLRIKNRNLGVKK
jgi:large subunit ribosomal protein L40e